MEPFPYHLSIRLLHNIDIINKDGMDAIFLFLSFKGNQIAGRVTFHIRSLHSLTYFWEWPMLMIMMIRPWGSDLCTGRCVASLCLLSVLVQRNCSCNISLLCYMCCVCRGTGVEERGRRLWRRLPLGALSHSVYLLHCAIWRRWTLVDCSGMRKTR